jgi:hypothetical protein
MTLPTRPTRRFEVAGRPVAVYDGLLPGPVLSQLVAAIEASPFTRSEVATPESAQYKHWAMNVRLEQLASSPLLGMAQPAIDEFRPGRRYRCYRAYCNHASYGDMLHIHTDAQPQADELTALWYLARDWRPDWGGETLFYDADHDAVAAVSPRPGRLVVFDGSIPHAGRPPNRICVAPRYSFALKYEAVAG